MRERRHGDGAVGGARGRIAARHRAHGGRRRPGGGARARGGGPRGHADRSRGDGVHGGVAGDLTSRAPSTRRSPMFEGLSVAMVTPFRNGAVDREATARLVDHMIEGGVQGLVVSGSTGEAATCTVEERRELWAFVRDRAKKRVWVVA